MLALSGSQLEIYERLGCARKFIDEYYDTPLDLSEIAQQAGFSRFHFIRLFRKVYNKTPHQYLIQKRIEQARYLLVSSELSITEICFAVGFQSLGSFSTLFDKYTGDSPSIYRNKFLERQQTRPQFIPSCFLSYCNQKNSRPD